MKYAEYNIQNNTIVQYGPINVYMPLSISTYHLFEAALATISASGILRYDATSPTPLDLVIFSPISLQILLSSFRLVGEIFI